MATNQEIERPTFCAAHPNVETSLRCGKCGNPICPKCLVFTPVGARCRACANVRPLPTFQVGPIHYLRGGLAGVVAAIAGGIAWALISLVIPFFGVLLVLGQAYLSGELVSRRANRKRSKGLRLIAVVSLLLGYLVYGLVIVLIRFPRLPLSAELVAEVGLGQFVALLSNPLMLLVFALAVYIAVTRV